jgi:glycerol-3-phosphate dehydrogenase/glycosyltransferase involved in cell wall biosynthesis
VKILFLAPQPFYIERGTPIAIDLLLAELSAQGHEVHLLTFPDGTDRHYEGLTIQRIGQRVRNSGAYDGSGGKPASRRPIGPGFSLAKVWLDIRMFFAAWRQLSTGDFDLVHAVEEAGFIAWLLKKRFGTPFIYDMDSLLSEQVCAALPWLRPLKGLMRWLESKVVREACAVAPMCDEIAFFARAHRNRGIHLIKDVALFDELSNTPTEDLRTRLEVPGMMILYVGNLENYQGIDLLLEACQQAFASNTDATLVLIGGSEGHIEKYRNRVEALGISARVRFAGPRPVEHLAEYLCQADVLVSARSQGTNTPMKIYSYLYSGVVTVATRLPTHTQVLNDANAMLADANADSFSDALLCMLDDKERRLRLGRAAHETAKQSHSRDSFKQAVEELYAGVSNFLGVSNTIGNEITVQRSQIVIAGGGITGSSIALRAAGLGYSVTLLEKNDFGGGASANNLRTIHGGLRYLQHGDIRRSRMSARCQNEWIANYPHLVEPLKFILPCGPGLFRSEPVYRFGLWLYHTVIRWGLGWPWKPADKADSYGASYGTTVIDEQDTPGALAGEVAFWQELQVQHPERGVLAQVLSARKLGANCLNYQQVTDVQRISKRKFLVQSVDQLNQQAWAIQCDWFIDATGAGFDLPGLPDELPKELSVRHADVNWVKGVNLVFDSAPQHACAWGIDSANNRRKLFICPWQDRLVAGTWYFEHTLSDGPLLLDEDELQLCMKDLSSSRQPGFSQDSLAHIELGLLPVRSGSGELENRLLSHPIIDVSLDAPGLIRVVAVKYTTAEDVAEQVIKLVKSTTPERQARIGQARYGSEFEDVSIAGVSRYREDLVSMFSQGTELDDIDRLVSRYGSSASTILERQVEQPDKSQCIPNTRVSLAEVDFVLEHELVRKLSDLVIRRTDIGAARRPDNDSLEYLMDYLVQNHQWDDGDREAQIADVYDWYRRVNT